MRENYTCYWIASTTSRVGQTFPHPRSPVQGRGDLWASLPRLDTYVEHQRPGELKVEWGRLSSLPGPGTYPSCSSELRDLSRVGRDPLQQPRLARCPALQQPICPTSRPLSVPLKCRAPESLHLLRTQSNNAPPQQKEPLPAQRPFLLAPNSPPRG
jgi:hypothetical protein